MDYWIECIAEALDEVEIVATQDQINKVAEFVKGAHEVYSEVHGHHFIPNPLVTENSQLREELEKERDKVTCKVCNGRGDIIERWLGRESRSTCDRCMGEGRHNL